MFVICGLLKDDPIKQVIETYGISDISHSKFKQLIVLLHLNVVFVTVDL